MKGLKKGPGMAAWIFLFCAAAFGQQPQVLHNFRLPDYDENGDLRADIQGESGVILPQGQIEITNLKMTFYEQGAEAMRIFTPRCVYDREKQTAESDADILVERPEVILSGAGFKFHTARKQLRIKDKTRVILPSVRDKMQPQPEPEDQ